MYVGLYSCAHICMCTCIYIIDHIHPLELVMYVLDIQNRGLVEIFCYFQSLLLGREVECLKGDNRNISRK